VAHIYDENEHPAHTGAPYYSATDSVNSLCPISTPPEPVKLKLVWGKHVCKVSEKCPDNVLEVSESIPNMSDTIRVQCPKSVPNMSKSVPNMSKSV
jgi:hypothetical protein